MIEVLRPPVNPPGTDGQFDDIRKMLQQMQRHGVGTGHDLDALQEQMAQAQEQARQVMERVGPQLERRAAETGASVRARKTSHLRATFASSDGSCQMNVQAQWPGPEGGRAMTITEPMTDGNHADFGIAVQHKRQLQEAMDLARDLAQRSGQDHTALQARVQTMKRPFTWQPRSCQELLNMCPKAQCSPGHLRLEEVTADRLVGTFDFYVKKVTRDPPPEFLSLPCDVRAARTPVAHVTGYFSATSSVEDARTLFDVFLPGRRGGNLPGVIRWDEEEDDD